jgi:hypothetical protein
MDALSRIIKLVRKKDASDYPTLRSGIPSLLVLPKWE